MDVASPKFTVAEIAGALGVHRKTVADQLAGVVPDADQVKVVRGQTATVYPVGRLPAPLRERLESAATRQGYSAGEFGVSAFVASARQPWNPGVPVGRMRPEQVAAAKSRCVILGPLVRVRGDSSIDDLARRGPGLYREATGKDVAQRTIRRWIELALERDRRFEDWSRWEIWLDPVVRSVVSVDSTPSERAIAPRLTDAVAAIADPSRPNRRDSDAVWMAALDDASALVKAGETEKRARTALVGILWRAAIPLAKNREALSKQFQRKRELWLVSDGRPVAVKDARVEANQRRSWELPEDDYRVILRHALEFESVATGFRYARERGLLSKETAARFVAENADKSYVPHTIARQITPEFKRLLPSKVGPRAARLAGPYIERDYSGMEAGDWWQSDDMTGVYQFYDVRPDASLYLGQGQFLPMMDLRSLFILGFSLVPARGYTAAAIRSLITRCHDEHGLPRKGFYFEGGIWERARLLKGRASDSELPLSELEPGLREFGLHFEHARNPRAKVIERVLGLLQVKMQALPGYSGRDARKDLPEAIKKQITDVNTGRAHPSKYFLSKTELAEKLQVICEGWNAEKHGKRARILAGRSPQDVYLERRTDDIQHLGEGYRHLLATHRFPMKVGRNGIKVAPSFGGGRYLSLELLNRKGEQMLVWLDVDDLSRITVSNLNHESPFVVPRIEPLAAMGATPEELRDAMALQRAPVSRGNAVFKILKGGATAFRKVVPDRNAVRLAEEFRIRNQEHVEQVAEDAKQRAELAEVRQRITEQAASPEVLDALEARLVSSGTLLPAPARVGFDRELRGARLVERALKKGARESGRENS